MRWWWKQKIYNKALGVKCDFCHVKAKGFTDSLDYVSDLEPMKEEARKMMRMVIDINKKNFHYNKKDRPEYLNTVTCKALLSVHLILITLF